MLRLATIIDFAAVYAIYMDELVVPYLGYDPMSEDQFLPLYIELIQSNTFFVFESSGIVKGFCRAIQHPGRARHGAYIGTFAVAPRERGTGLAKRLLEVAITMLQSKGVSRIELMLEADNPRALAFYKNQGFVHEGTLRCAYKRSHEEKYVDELLLAKLLTPLESKNAT
jgi:ribosomal protein S18 acetylase RimI-like enzyme